MKTTNASILLIVCIFLSVSASSAQNTEQDSLARKNLGFSFIPIIFYQSDTKLALGGIGIVFFRSDGDSDARPSTFSPAVIYTQNKQSILQLSLDHYWQKETYRIFGGMTHIKFPDKFWGIGKDTPDSAEEEYTPRLYAGEINLQKMIRKDLNAGVLYWVGNLKIIEYDPDGQLQHGFITGSLGGTAAAAGVFFNFDTRDNILNPGSGSYYQAWFTFANGSLGSDFIFNKHTFDLRHYFPVRQSDVLAVQAYTQIVTGDAPFPLISIFGGENPLRGYRAGRYRDNHLVAFRAEYRMPVWWRFGLAFFGGFGDVVDEMKSIQPRKFKHSIGWGIRYMLVPQEKINLRIDFGYGKGSTDLQITLMEAF